MNMKEITDSSEQIEIELDDETTAIAEKLAQDKGITVEELLQELLHEAIGTGYFDNAEQITVDDSLDL